MNAITATTAMIDAVMPARIESAQFGADGRFLDHLERHRQLARTQRDRELVGALDGEAAIDHGAAAEDRLVDVRRRDDDAVDDDRERLAGILLRHLGEAFGARAVQLERNARLAGLLVIALLGVDQHVAGDHHLALTAILPPPLMRQDHIAGRRDRRAAPQSRRRWQSTRRNSSFAVLPTSALSAVGILQAGDLHDDTVGAFADHGRLDGAERVDARIDHLARVVHRGFDGLVDARLGRRQHERRRIDHGHVPLALAGGAHAAAGDRSSFSRAASTLDGSRTMKLTLPPWIEMSPMSTLGSRRISTRAPGPASESSAWPGGRHPCSPRAADSCRRQGPGPG
jgi:hypothetical protein